MHRNALSRKGRVAVRGGWKAGRCNGPKLNGFLVTWLGIPVKWGANPLPEAGGRQEEYNSLIDLR